MMSLSECPHNPFKCERSIFVEWSGKSPWGKPRRIECGKFFHDEEGKLCFKETGKVCVNDPSDWWEDYLLSLKKIESAEK